MNTAKGKYLDTCLFQLCQAFCHKASVALIRRRRIKQITGLNKQIDVLPYRKICRLLKSLTQPPLTFFALAVMLTKRCVAKMVIGRQHDADDIFLPLLLLRSRALFYFFHTIDRKSVV